MKILDNTHERHFECFLAILNGVVFGVLKAEKCIEKL